jgi:hypothetical protein
MSLVPSDTAVHREAEIYAQQPDGKWSCGSGCAVGGLLVLTAAHVVCDESGQPHRTVLVRQLGQQQLIHAKVIWFGVGRQDDAALLVILDETSWTPPPVPLRWGRLATNKPESCYSVGFPDFQNTLDYRDTERACGVISPGTMIKGRLYSINVASPPGRVEGSPSPWVGMSGAGLFCRGMLIGIVIEDPLGHNSRRLVAVPIVALLRDEKFCNLVRGDTGREISAEPVEFSAISTTLPVIRSPGALLRADVSEVPFRSSPVFEDITAWCVEDNSSLSVRLVVGPGGQGKTRLARQLAQVMKSRGWEALFVDPDAPLDELTVVSEVRSSLLVVVDYAESREDHLVQLIKSMNLAGEIGRLLLLARTNGEWRDALARRSALLSTVVAEAPVMHLQSVDSTKSGRMEAWQQAAKAFAGALPSMPGYEGSDGAEILSKLRAPSLSEKRFDRILEIHLNALVSLLEAARPLAPENADAVDILIRHESRYWAGLAKTSGVKLGATTQKRVVAAATVWSASDRKEALLVLRHTPGTDKLSLQERLTLAEWINNLYADDGEVEDNVNVGGVERRYWSRVQPDLIAEHIVGQVLNEDDCPELLDKAINSASDAQITNSLALLAQASVYYPHVDQIIRRIVLKNPFALKSAAAVATWVERPVALTDAVKEGRKERGIPAPGPADRLAPAPSSSNGATVAAGSNATEITWPPPVRSYSRETPIFNVSNTAICSLALLSSALPIANLVGLIVSTVLAACVGIAAVVLLVKYIRAGRGRARN